MVDKLGQVCKLAIGLYIIKSCQCICTHVSLRVLKVMEIPCLLAISGTVSTSEI